MLPVSEVEITAATQTKDRLFVLIVSGAWLAAKVRKTLTSIKEIIAWMALTKKGFKKNKAQPLINSEEVNM